MTAKTLCFALLALAILAPAVARAEPEAHRRDQEAAREDEDGVYVSSADAGIIGLRGSATRVDGAHDRSALGIQLAGFGEAVRSTGFFSAKVSHEFAVGGGGAGFEGALGGSLALGLRLPIDRKQGVVARVGVRAFVLGNDDFYNSMVELPQAQLAYQYLTRRGLRFEAGATLGAVLIGRYHDDSGARRNLRNFEVGLYGLLQTPIVRLSAEGLQMTGKSSEGTAPVRIIRGLACITPSPLAICGDARWFDIQSTGVLASGGASKAFYGGITLGLVGR